MLYRIGISKATDQTITTFYNNLNMKMIANHQLKVIIV